MIHSKVTQRTPKSQHASDPQLIGFHTHRPRHCSRSQSFKHHRGERLYLEQKHPTLHTDTLLRGLKTNAKNAYSQHPSFIEE